MFSFCSFSTTCVQQPLLSYYTHHTRTWSITSAVQGIFHHAHIVMKIHYEYAPHTYVRSRVSYLIFRLISCHVKNFTHSFDHSTMSSQCSGTPISFPMHMYDSVYMLYMLYTHTRVHSWRNTCGEQALTKYQKGSATNSRAKCVWTFPTVHIYMVGF